MFFKLYKWYRIAQRITYNQSGPGYIHNNLNSEAIAKTESRGVPKEK